MAPLLALQAALATAVLALGAAGLLWPELVPAVPQSGGRAALPLMTASLVLFGVLANRAVRTFALTRRPDDLVVGVACVWLAVASIATLTCTPGTLGFYIGHLLEITGVLLIGVPVALDLRRGGASRPLVGDLSARRSWRARRRTSACASGRSWSASAPTTARPRATRAASR